MSYRQHRKNCSVTVFGVCDCGAIKPRVIVPSWRADPQAIAEVAKTLALFCNPVAEPEAWEGIAESVLRRLHEKGLY